MKRQQQLIDDLQDLVSRLEGEDKFVTPKQAQKLAKEFKQDYNGSYLQLDMLMNLLEKLAGEVRSKDIKSKAYNESVVEGGGNKFDYHGVGVTPVESHKRYEYPEDKQLDRYEDDLEQVKQQLKPIKKKEKQIKDSIKQREQELVDEGKAEFKTSTKYNKYS